MAAYEELVGVYNAEGTILGELRYVVGRFLGTVHCALCDITHGAILEKRASRALRGELDVPIRFAHLDDQGAAIRCGTEGATPCVVGRRGQGWHIVLDDTALASCGGDVETFRRLLDERLVGDNAPRCTL